MKKILAVLILAVSFILSTSPVLAVIPGGQPCTNNPEPCESDYGCLPLQSDPSKKVCQYIPARDCTIDGTKVCVTKDKDYNCLPLQSDPNKKVCQYIPGHDCKVGDTTCGTDYTCSSLQSDPNKTVCQFTPVSAVFGKIKAPDALKGLVAKDPSGAGGLGILFSNLITLFYIIAMLVLIFMIVWGAFDWITSEGDKEKVGGARNKIINAIIGIILFAAAFGIIRILGTFTGFKFFVGQ